MPPTVVNDIHSELNESRDVQLLAECVASPGHGPASTTRAAARTSSRRPPGK